MNKLLLLISVVTSCLFAQFTESEVLVFYAPDCRYCKYLLNTFLPNLEKNFGIEVKIFNVEIVKNLYYLEKLEENVKEVGDELPAVFFRDSVLYGSEVVFKQLPDIINQYQTDASVHITYFIKPGCRECSRVDYIIKAITQEQKNIVVHTYNIRIKENKLLAEAISTRLNVPEKDRQIAPTLFLGEDYLVKGGISLTKLKELLHKYRFGTKNFEILNPEIRALSERLIQERFNSIGLMTIVGAGLLDGINPCAFATIVFFIGYLVFLGRRKREILLVGIFFTLAVFITYFAVGLGFFKILDLVTGIQGLSRIIFLGFGTIAILLGLLSLYDFIKARAGKLDEMKLQLPNNFKVKIHKSIKAETKTFGIGLGAFIAGIVVSLLEFACTGQVYLPTITYVVANPALKVKAIALLLFYNIMFVTPLIVITVLGIIFTTEKIGKALRSQIVTVKFLTALLFFALGILLIFFS